MAIVGETDLLDGPHTPLEGLTGSSEARALVSKHFPGKPYCLVEEWIVFHVDVTDDERAKVHEAGQLPLVLFAHKVIEDSQGRFQPGDWVRSSMCASTIDGWMFETKNTVYVLMGSGHEKTASLKTIFSFF